MRSEREIRAMLKEVEKTIDEESDSEEPNVVIQEALIWVLENYVSDGRITDYLPEPQ